MCDQNTSVGLTAAPAARAPVLRIWPRVSMGMLLFKHVWVGGCAVWRHALATRSRTSCQCTHLPWQPGTPPAAALQVEPKQDAVPIPKAALSKEQRPWSGPCGLATPDVLLHPCWPLRARHGHKRSTGSCCSLRCRSLLHFTSCDAMDRRHGLLAVRRAHSECAIRSLHIMGTKLLLAGCSAHRAQRCSKQSLILGIAPHRCDVHLDPPA